MKDRNIFIGSNVYMNEWYTQKEVAEQLGVSKATVYHYAKQGKIRKIADPHRLHREARYYKEEVDRLAHGERRDIQPVCVLRKLRNS